jgi:hypothetical protein
MPSNPKIGSQKLLLHATFNTLELLNKALYIEEGF